MIHSLPKHALFALILLGFSTLSAPSHAITLGQMGQIAQNAPQAAFQTVEFTAPQAEDRTPQWQRVKANLGRDMAALQSCLDDAGLCNGTAQAAWREMVLGLQDQDQDVQLQIVNAFFNKWQYTADNDAYARSDYWASPLEFMNNSGDCEDYAIAKYTTLLFLGFRDEQMRIIALVDNNRGGIGHAVLSVASNGSDMILDNLTNNVYADNQQTGYSPRFAVNQGGVYTYAQQPQLIWVSAE
jgi:predicted transglutaminase-like cysteine proteinase